MVDLLVTSNLFEDDFGVLRWGGGLRPPVPWQSSALWRLSRTGGHGGPGTSRLWHWRRRGPQSLRRQPRPFSPNPMGPAFNMPPQGSSYPPPGNMNFSSQPFNQYLGQNFSPPGGQMRLGPVGGSRLPWDNLLEREELGPPPLQCFTQPGAPFGPSLQRPGQGLPSLPPNTSPFPGPDPGFPGPGGEDGGKPLNPLLFPRSSGSPTTAINGNQPSFRIPPTPNSSSSSGRSGGTPDANSLAPPGKAGGGSGLQPSLERVYPCGA